MILIGVFCSSARLTLFEEFTSDNIEFQRDCSSRKILGAIEDAGQHLNTSEKLHIQLVLMNTIGSILLQILCCKVC